MRTTLSFPTLSRNSFLKVILGGAADALAQRTGFARPNPSLTQESTPPLVPELTQDVRLYGSTAAKIGPNVQFNELKIQANFGDSSSLTWNVSASDAGNFELFLSYAAAEPGFTAEVRSGTSLVKVKLDATEGIYKGKDPFYNFERTKLEGRLRLTRGVNPVSLQVRSPGEGKTLGFRCLELMPASAMKRLESAAERARASRASTDWFVEAKYGAMFHWTDFSLPREGPKKPYPDAVNAFDVDAFARLVEETGAGYVILTLNHAHPHCAAPIHAWEAIHPGWTTRRDLIGEIADALKQHGIRLLLYINSPIMTKLGEDIRQTGLYQLTYSEEQFVEIHKQILNEIGSRYGQRLAGYWFDSWYQSLAAYPDVPIESIYEFCKTGNPARITAFNFWVFPVLTPWQDYWAGELNELHMPFQSRYLQRGAGKGFQAHGMLSMLPSWVHSDPGPIPPPQFSAADLIACVKANVEHQAVTTINIGIYQEGTIEETSRQMMRELRQAIKGG
jgi:hypothetical protein